MSINKYVELHCHSNYSFHDGASFIHELIVKAMELKYPALALTDHNNLCGAIEFSKTAKSLGIRPIIGAEVTLMSGHHITLLAKNRHGYSNLCKMLSISHHGIDRKEPKLNPDFLQNHSNGLILLTGCNKGEIPSLVQQNKHSEAEATLKHYIECFGSNNLYLELQQNFINGDTKRNFDMIRMAQKFSLGAVATNNVHYHVRERHRLQDCLVAIKHLKTLENSHLERRSNSEFYLKSQQEMSDLYKHYTPAISNTMIIADRCADLDITRDLDYKFPDFPVPSGFTQWQYLEQLCKKAAIRRYGILNHNLKTRLEKELALVKTHNLAGFFLICHDIIQIAQKIMLDIGLVKPDANMGAPPPGRSRGSSVAMLVGYLLGLSHIDPVEFNLSLERFLPGDKLESVPDVDLDFPRNIREELIKRIHEKYGFKHAALTGMVTKYRFKGALKVLGKTLNLPIDEVNQLANSVAHMQPEKLNSKLLKIPKFRDRLQTRGWKNLISLASDLNRFPKYLAQHPGGMVISSTPLTEMVPILPSVIPNRYVMQWDKDSIETTGFVKIDLLALATLSQIQETLNLIKNHDGNMPDITRIDYKDKAVYKMLCDGDTIGVFQVESAAQIQTIKRIRPMNLIDMAHEVAAVRPGVGVNDGVTEYINRRNGLKPESYDHELEKRALIRTRGVILFQDQVNQIAIDVANFSATEADQLRRSYGQQNSHHLIQSYWKKFQYGAKKNGVDEKTARKIFKKFNKQYMFPESHAFAFGITAYQSAWLKYHYPLEFFVAIFNQQPIGFYNSETLKEDAKRHGINVLNPDINKSTRICVPEGRAVRIGFLNVKAVGNSSAQKILESRKLNGKFQSISDFMRRTRMIRTVLENLVDAGAFDALVEDRRSAKWEIGLRYNPTTNQSSMPMSINQDMAKLPKLTGWEKMESEYETMSIHPKNHIMAYLRKKIDRNVIKSTELDRLPEESEVLVAGLVIRRQRPNGKTVFITIEDEFGHIPVIAWASTYKRYYEIFNQSLVLIKGKVSKRDTTINIIASHASKITQAINLPKSRDWS